MDKINNLLPEIICKIGSSLSAKEAAFTTVLSKSWRNLIPIERILFFNDSFRESFTNFVDRVFNLPASSRIRLFSVKWRPLRKPAQYDHVNRCLRDVVLERGILILFLDVNVKEGYALPSQVFTCKTLSKLSLGTGFAIGSLPDNASLPALKQLYLYSVWLYSFGRCAFQTLCDASPVLEELGIVGIELERWKWSCTLSSPTLQRRTILRTEWKPFAGGDEVFQLDCRGLAYDFDRISFDTPALTYLEYSDYVPKKYLIINLNSLVKAKLNLCVDEDGVWDESHANSFDPMNLINVLKNVEVLDLTIDTIEGSMHSWVQGDQLLCQCMSEYSFLLSCRVKFLRITEYDGFIGELDYIKHFMEKLLCLELVKISAQIYCDKKVKVMEDLLMLPRASPKCKINVKFS